MADDEGQKPEETKKKSKKTADEPVDEARFTEGELEAAVQKAVEKERKKSEEAASKAEKERTDAEEKRKGEFEKLYQSETARSKELESANAALKLEMRTKDVQLALRDHLAAKHKDYLPNAKYILPLIEFDADTTDEEIGKRITDAAAAYVKDNPRTITGGAPERGPTPDPSGVDKKRKIDNPVPFYMGRH